MKKRPDLSLLPLFTMLFASTGLSAQTLCDSVIVGPVHYSATDPNTIEIGAFTTTSDCIGYPSFVLYNDQGDTLAKETVNFFCLSFGPWPGIHALDVFPGANLGNGPQLLTLELYSGFGDTLVCSWALMVDLCPPDSCVYAQLTFTDWHDQLVQGQVYWFLEDHLSATVGSGVFELDGVNRNAEDSVCIAPGTDYTLWVSPFTPIDVSDSINLAVSSNQGITGLINYFQNDNVPSDMVFDWYEACVEIQNAVAAHDQPWIQAFHDGRHLVVRALGFGLQEVELYDMHGRLLLREQPTSVPLRIATDGLSSGIHVLVARNKEGERMTRRVHIPQ
ncbi:MAG: hypothetical protein KDB88_07370 [Flavobacteriales bacterium]|nr:hypothetical protein [Flavobacteriales bacterium]